MALTIAAVAANKGITLGRLTVSVESRTELAATIGGANRDRHFVADQRTCLDRPGAGFCPLELVAAALGA